MEHVDTLLVYICHIANDEAVFRYNKLKTAIAGFNKYKIVWALDCSKDKEAPSKLSNGYGVPLDDIVPIEYVYDDFFERARYKKFAHLVDFSNISLKSVYEAERRIKYNYVWMVEFDCCYYGDWTNFFKKYEQSDADYIGFNKINVLSLNWMHTPYKQTLQKMLNDRVVLLNTLNCMARLSKNAINNVYEFYRKYNGSNDIHFELALPTVCYNYGMKIYDDIMPAYTFNPAFTIDQLDESTKNTLVHPMKLDQSYKTLLEKQ